MPARASDHCRYAAWVCFLQSFGPGGSQDQSHCRKSDAKCIAPLALSYSVLFFPNILGGVSLGGVALLCVLYGPRSAAS